MRHDARGHIPALDGIRGIAIVAVLIFHLNGQLQYRFQNKIEENAVTQGLLAVSNYGWVGVDLFFVLSGFLISGILIDSRESASYYRTFYIRRTLRIFPLYFGFLAVMLLVLPSFVHTTTGGFSSAADHQWYLWTYCSNMGAAFYDVKFGPFAHFWSLAVEEHFYLIWPFIVLASPPAKLARICAFFVVAALATRLALVVAGLPTAAHFIMPARLDAFGLGALCAIALREPVDAQRRRLFGRALLGASVVMTAILAGLYTLGGPSSIGLAEALRYTILATLSASLVWLAATKTSGSVYARVFSSSPLRTMGKYSYGLYVIHLPMLPILYEIEQRLFRMIGWQPASQFAAILVFDAFGSACVLAAAMMSWHFFEKHFIGLKARFRYVA